MKKPQQSLINSFRCAFRGVWVALLTQRNLKVQIAIGVLIVIVAGLLRITLMEWCSLILCMGLVLVAELINTAIEATVDLATPDYHDLARSAKDISAGAVLVASILAAIVGILILLPKLLQSFSAH